MAPPRPAKGQSNKPTTPPHDTSCCPWQLTFCSSTGLIANLVIANHNLSAQIPAIVANHPYLNTIQFDSPPNLRGPIPVTITKLHRLRAFTITSSQLSGGIPGLLAKIKMPELINLHSNAPPHPVLPWRYHPHQLA